jgi:hypothetical protein
MSHLAYIITTLNILTQPAESRIVNTLTNCGTLQGTTYEYTAPIFLYCILSCKVFSTSHDLYTRNVPLEDVCQWMLKHTRLGVKFTGLADIMPLYQWSWSNDFLSLSQERGNFKQFFFPRKLLLCVVYNFYRFSVVQRLLQRSVHC